MKFGDMARASAVSGFLLAVINSYSRVSVIELYDNFWMLIMILAHNAVANAVAWMSSVAPCLVTSVSGSRTSLSQ